jgi:hypothetical protein
MDQYSLRLGNQIVETSRPDDTQMRIYAYIDSRVEHGRLTIGKYYGSDTSGTLPPCDVKGEHLREQQLGDYLETWEASIRG